LNYAYPCDAITVINQISVWVSSSSPVVVAHNNYIRCDSVGDIDRTPAIEDRIDSAIPVDYRPDLGTVLASGGSFLDTDRVEGRCSNRGVECLLYCRGSTATAARKEV